MATASRCAFTPASSLSRYVYHFLSTHQLLFYFDASLVHLPSGASVQSSTALVSPLSPPVQSTHECLANIESSAILHRHAEDRDLARNVVPQRRSARNPVRSALGPYTATRSFSCSCAPPVPERLLPTLSPCQIRASHVPTTRSLPFDSSRRLPIGTAVNNRRTRSNTSSSVPVSASVGLFCVRP
ncbi:hypothetical protein TRVL_09664 [Trypanosoma vivax]|nr:hypothetical protein TRVL_09664 [Trypanosoma vivax]